MPDNLVTAAQLQRFAPSCDYMALGPALDAAFRAHEINTPRRIRHCMAHLHVEAQGLTRLEENLNYSAARLVQVWPRRFPDLGAALPYAHAPAKLAEKVYGGRMGNIHAGDAWKYRGGGLIMLTFLANYRRATKWSGLPLEDQPELARQPKAAAVIAASFWQTEGLNQVVDADDGEQALADVAKALQLNEADDVAEATDIINGGQTGLADRQRQLLRAGTIWRD